MSYDDIISDYAKEKRQREEQDRADAQKHLNDLNQRFKNYANQVRSLILSEFEKISASLRRNAIQADIKNHYRIPEVKADLIGAELQVGTRRESSIYIGVAVDSSEFQVRYKSPRFNDVDSVHSTQITKEHVEAYCKVFLERCLP